MKYFIVYRRNQLVECAVAALAELILGYDEWRDDDKVICLPLWDKIERMDEMKNAIVVVLGTYWSKEDIAILCQRERDNNVMLYDYSPDIHAGYDVDFAILSLECTPTLLKPSRNALFGPLQAFLEFIESRCQYVLKSTASSLLERNKGLFLDLDAYSLKQQKKEMELLVTGIYSLEEGQGSKPVLQRLFSDELKLEETLERGRIIHTNNVQLARKTALESSKLITLHDGKTARIAVTSHYFIRLIGEELLNRGDADISIVQRICLDDTKPDAVAYTLMTRDPTIDVSRYTIPYGGGGSASLSGVSMAYDFELPPFCHVPPTDK